MPTYILFKMIMQRRGTGNREQGTGNRERGTGNGERGTGNGQRGTGNGERATGNGERGTGNLILSAISNSPYLFSVCFTSFFPVPLSSL